MVAITVITDDRQIVLSHWGIPDPLGSERMTTVESSFCQHVVRSTEPLIVEDARRHALVQHSPLIGEYGILAYAGWPWRTPDGHVQGAFCAMDVLPRAWTAAEHDILRDFADMVTDAFAVCPALPSGRGGMAPPAELLLDQPLAGVGVIQGGRISYANARLAEILGYTERELLELGDVASLVPEEDRQWLLELSRHFLNRQSVPAARTFRCLRKDGQVVWVEMYASRSVVGKTPSIVATVLDVSGRKRSEQALQEAQEHLRLLARATNDLTVDWDIRTGALSWDPSAHRVLRYDSNEMGDSFEWWSERIHPEDRDTVTVGLRSLLGGSGDTWTSEFRFRRGDGAYASLLTRGYLARGLRGAPLRMTCAILDVTERRQAEDAQRFLAQASTILAESLAPDFTLSRLSSLIVPRLADFCAIQVLPEGAFPAQAVTGHVVAEKAELLKAEVDRDAEPDRLHQVAEPVLAAREPTLIPVVTPRSLRRLKLPPDLRRRLRPLQPTSLLAVPLIFRGRVLGAMAWGMAESDRHFDPTDLQLAQDLAHRIAMAVGDARLYAEAQQAISSREAIINMVSHDLRNPLGTISMAADLIRDTGPERREDNRNWLDMIYRSADRMNGIIQDLLDLSRIDAGGFVVEPRACSAQDLLSDARESFEPLARQKQISLNVSAGEDLPLLYADPRQLQRVFSNLIGNALKFTPEGGVAEVLATHLGDEVLFTVRDNGPGIHPGELPHVFERYWQAREHDRRGVGLGLSIAKGIVDLHGGRISAESEPGKGATFYFTSPCSGPGQ
jgi:PAS domain S-box-containing protein